VVSVGLTLPAPAVKFRICWSCRVFGASWSVGGCIRGSGGRPGWRGPPRTPA